MPVNGEAIFGTRPWLIFGEGAGDVSAGNFGEGKARPYSATDIRFTAKGDTVYAFALGWPEKPLVIRSMAKNSPLVRGEVNNVALLGYDGKLQWSRTDEGLVINVPAQKPCEHAFAFKITGLATNASADTSNLPYVPKPLPAAPAKAKGKAKAKVTPGKPVAQAADGAITLGADAAETHGSRIQLEARGGQPNLGYWDDAADWASWKVNVTQAGSYEATATVATAKGESQFVLEVGSQKLDCRIPNTGEWSKYQTVPLGKVDVKQPGEIVVNLRPKDAASWKAINLAAVTLKPAK
jgi:alpha-L-fucosidase